MRTTFTLDDDVVPEVERLRREEGIGISEAVNRLIRLGMVTRPVTRRYRHVGASGWSAMADDGSFVRIVTDPRVKTDPLSSERAWAYIEAWLAEGPAWIPPATERTARVLQSLVATHSITGNLVPDAQLCALAIEHGLEVMSADTDFARFPEVRWRNPLV